MVDERELKKKEGPIVPNLSYCKKFRGIRESPTNGRLWISHQSKTNRMGTYQKLEISRIERLIERKKRGNKSRQRHLGGGGSLSICPNRCVKGGYDYYYPGVIDLKKRVTA